MEEIHDILYTRLTHSGWQLLPNAMMLSCLCSFGLMDVKADETLQGLYGRRKSVLID